MRNMDGDHALERELSLFERYLARECSPDEVLQVEQLTHCDARRARLLRDLTALKQATRALDDRWNVDSLWHEVRSHLDAPAPASPRRAASLGQSRGREQLTSRHSWYRRWAWPVGRTAALVAIAVGGTLVWSALRVGSSVASVPSAMRVYRTPPGQQAVVHLVDGTRVTLAASGTLVVRKDFLRGSRDVDLDGQAYFEVAENASSPFRVHTGNVVTRVHGTEFSVRAYSGESRVQVVVASGRVTVWPAEPTRGRIGPETELGPGDLARVSRDGTIYVEHHVDVPGYLSWRDGWLTFIDAPVPEILAELERWMGIEFTLADPSIAARVLTTRIRPAALQSTLAVLEAGLNVRAVQSDSGVRLEMTGARGERATGSIRR